MKSNVRAQKPKVKNIGILDIFPGKFIDLYDNDYNDIVAINPRAAGKTKCFVKYSILLMMTNKQMDTVMVRKTHTSLEKSLVLEVKEALEFFGLTSEWTYLKQDKIFKNNYTGQGIYLSGSEEERIKGIITQNKIGFLLFDEIQQFSSSTEINQIVSTFSRRMTDDSKVIMSGNLPKVLTHFIYEFRETQRQAGAHIHESTYLDIVDLLPKRFVQKINQVRDTDKKEYEYIYLGITSGFAGTIFDNIKESTFVKKAFDNTDMLLVGIDAGNSVTDPSTMVIVQKNGNKLCVIDELAIYEGSPNEIVDAMKDVLNKYSGHRQLIYVDSAALWLTKALREAHINAQPCVKGPGSIESGITILRGLIGGDDLYIMDHLTGLKKELSLYARNDKNVPIDKHNHFIDALRYAIYSPLSKGRIRLRR